MIYLFHGKFYLEGKVPYFTANTLKNFDIVNYSTVLMILKVSANYFVIGNKAHE